jgi:Tetratricopeptide repeat.
MKIKVNLMFCIFCITLLMLGCTKNEKYEYRKSGLEYFTYENYEGAIVEFDKAINASSGIIGGFEKDVLSYKGEALIRLGDYERAVSVYEKLKTMDKKNKDFQYLFYMSEAGKLESENDYENAVVKYEEALAIKENADIYNRLGICESELENYEEALIYFAKGIALNDEDVLQILSKNEAITYGLMRNYEIAIDKYEVYVKMYVDDADAAKELAFFKSRVIDTDE